MRVGFDASPLVRPSSLGVARLVRELLAALEARGRLEVVRLAPEPGVALRGWRQRELPRLAARQGLAGIHAFTSSFPLRAPGARVQTVHELPWRHGVAENAGLAHRFWASLGTRRATRIVVPSAHVARDLERSPFVPRARLRVIPWGVAADFRDEPPAGVVDEAVLDRYRLDGQPFVLCPGAVRPKKNLSALLHGLAERLRAGQRPLRVVVTGGDGPQLRSDLGLASRLGLARWVSTLEAVEEPDWPSFLRQARAVAVLSHSEGFAFPVLEALASGTPVLVPTASAQSELAGAAGIVVEPGQPGSVGQGLQRALDERRTWRARGLERARAFSWERTAEALETLWQELA